MSIPTSTSTRRNLPRSTAKPRRGAAYTDGATSIILGVDPGTLVTGYGIIRRERNAIHLLGCGTVRNPATASMPLRLQRIYTELSDVIASYKPDECAIESAFYGKNAQSALKLGHARGVAILAAVQNEIPTTEYSPREVKKAVVGNGSASKEQVQYMVKSMLQLSNARMVLDASDAIAIAICHVHRLVSPTSKHRDWKSFIAAHPERVRG
jgi:crossover junction endodeoxyribonuclease RuvC